MKTILISVSEDRQPSVVTPQPLVEGENLTTQIDITPPESWAGYDVRCLLTTPTGKLIDAVACPVELTNTMLDGKGTLYAEFAAMKGSTEVWRTKSPVLLPVSAARSLIGDVDPAPLPNLVAEMVGAKNSCNTARDGAISAAQSAQETEADIEAAEVLRVAAEQARGAQFVSIPPTESAEISETELLDGTGWTSSGWTGDFASGFTHTAGNTSALSRSIGATGTKMYQLEFDVSAPLAADELTVQIGNSATFDLYKGDETHVSCGIQSVSDGPLVITPVSTCTKTVHNLSIKEIIAPYVTRTKITDSEAATSCEVRATKAARYNLFIGTEAGKYNTTGHDNVALGAFALGKNMSGFWNSAIGKSALGKNTAGSRNTAIGYSAMSNNICGHRNLAIGSFALCSNVNGNKNHAIGPDALYHNASGNGNMAMGWGAQYSRISGNSNLALGNNAMYYDQSGNYQIAIGDSAMANSTTGNNNLAIGYYALNRNSTGSDNIAIGLNAAKGAVGTNQSQNVVIGNYAAQNIAEGAVNNVILGHNAAQNLTTGKGNIVIGMNASAPDAAGYALMNIGNALYGDLYSKKIGIGIVSPAAILHLRAATGGNTDVPLKFTAGTLSTNPQSGAMEFDGNTLYFTINGVRKTVQVV